MKLIKFRNKTTKTVEFIPIMKASDYINNPSYEKVSEVFTNVN